MNHKAFYVFYIAFLILIFCLSSATSRTLSEGITYADLPKLPICGERIYRTCIAARKFEPPPPPQPTPPTSSPPKFDPPPTASPPQPTNPPSSPSPPPKIDPPPPPPRDSPPTPSSEPSRNTPPVPSGGSANAADSSNSSSSNGIGTGGTFAIVAVLLLSVIGVVGWCVWKRKKKAFHGNVMPTPVTGNGTGNNFLNSKIWFTYEELVKATNDFSAENILGAGGFGSVYKGRLPDGRDVAVKQLDIGGRQGDREFRAEVEIISRVHHRHLVSLVGYCISDNRRLLVYEYVPNNTLYFHLRAKGRPVLDWATRVKIAVGAARGIAYLHEDCHPRIIPETLSGRLV